MKRIVGGNGLVICFLLSGIIARVQGQTNLGLRMDNLGAEIMALKEQIATLTKMWADSPKEVERVMLRLSIYDLEGKLEQAKAEQDLLQKVEATVPPQVEKDVEMARLAIQVKTAKRKGMLLGAVLKAHPGDVKLVMKRHASASQFQQAREERILLQVERGMLDDKDLRIKRFTVRIEVMRKHLDLVKQEALRIRDAGDRAELDAECSRIAANLRVVEVKRALLRKEDKREPRG